ncbi:unnamed protein product [Soboliphyme baturini]|uniref:BZIP_Maf domain-containing protein n=1 Tax=Soboliphyme baturini TaxID=241478 RepID=A0A183J7T2_9BILA|nr:unnamed protein product [Soboliphyme baturini]
MLLDQYSKCDIADEEVDFVRNLREEIVLDLLKLRKCNRISQFRNKIAKDKINQERQKVDEQYLKLQNLLYEVSHIENEVVHCLEFKSKKDDIDLIPTEQFYEEAPVSVSKPVWM